MTTAVRLAVMPITSDTERGSAYRLEAVLP